MQNEKFRDSFEKSIKINQKVNRTSVGVSLVRFSLPHNF